MAPTTPGNRTTASPTATQLAAPRRGRPPKPSAKAIENQETRRLYTTALGSAGDDSDDESPNQNTANVNSKLDVLTRLVATLSETLTQQNIAVEGARAELKEIKAEQQELKTLNTQLQEEVRTLQAKLDSYSTSLPSTASWASIAAGRTTTTEGGTSLSRTSSNQNAKKEPNCLRISTSPSAPDGDPTIGPFGRYLPTQTANTCIRTALQRVEATKETQVSGPGTTKTGYVIRFKDLASKEAAKQDTEWLEELGNGTKLVKPRFGVVVHRMHIEGLQLPEQKKEAIEKSMEENNLAAKGYCVDDVAWLRSKDKPLGVSASLGIWFETPEAAEWTINNGVVCSQRYVGSVEAYQVKKKGCHRCQGFGHLAWSCKETIRCRHCIGGHDRRDCHPALTRSALIARAHMPQETKAVEFWPSPTHYNDHPQPANTTIEHHEIKSRNGGSHQQTSFPSEVDAGG